MDKPERGQSIDRADFPTLYITAVSYALTVRGAEYANYPEALKELVRTLGSRNDNDDREAED